MRQIHWKEVTPQPFLRKPCAEMLSETGFAVVQTAGARNSRTPAELREIVEVIHDTSYVVEFFNNAFARIDLPPCCEGDFIMHAKRGLNPVTESNSSTSNDHEYQNIYEAIHDELSTFAALLPDSGNGSRNPSDYPVRWHHAVKFLEKLENICQIEFKGRAYTESELKARVGRL